MRTYHAVPLHSQRGVTLIELLVGMAIGLLVIGVAGGALIASRGISGTVSDASDIQQQAAYAMRTIGQQLRQTGSLYLNLNPDQVTGVDAQTMAAVGLELQGSTQDVLSGTDTTVDVQYTRYTEPVFISAAEVSLSRNCLGGPTDELAGGAPNPAETLQSTFQFDAVKNELKCNGNSSTAGAQAIARNVADFQVRYLLQSGGGSGDTKLAYTDASGVGGNWNHVQGIEVCLVLFGDEAIGIPADSTYVGCDGEPHAFENNRMHLAFRNVFQLRSMGLHRL